MHAPVVPWPSWYVLTFKAKDTSLIFEVVGRKGGKVNGSSMRGVSWYLCRDIRLLSCLASHADRTYANATRMLRECYANAKIFIFTIIHACSWLYMPKTNFAIRLPGTNRFFRSASGGKA